MGRPRATPFEDPHRPGHGSRAHTGGSAVVDESMRPVSYI